MKRISSIDVTRGFVMVIMALDHVRDMIHVNSVTQSPTNLATTSPVLFFTRWITYLCAPTFVFLAGTSAYLSFKKNNDIIKTGNFLLSRGISLILLEFIVVNFGLFFDLGFHTFIFEVIAAIGFGFIVLSFLLRVNPKTIGIAALVIICCHNLVPLIPFADGSQLKKWLSLFFLPGALPFAKSVFVMAYPPIPWLGIMLAGFATGPFFALPENKKKKLFYTLGFSALILFCFIRFINIYGDLVPWSSQKDTMFTFLSFMNVTKYPPSLVFCLVTLGIMFLILTISEGIKNKFTSILLVYGKVPLFYFLVHFFLIHFILLIILCLQGFHFAQMDFADGSFGRPKGLQSGLQLWQVYLVWISVVAVLYKPCKWFGRYKATHTQRWVKYL